MADKFLIPLWITVKKNLRGWVGFRKSYVIFRVGHGKCLCLITRWVGGVKKGPKHAYVIFEWSLVNFIFFWSLNFICILTVELLIVRFGVQIPVFRFGQG